MATAVHLSTNNSKITVVSNLNKAYSNGVPTLNVASKVACISEVSLLYATIGSNKTCVDARTHTQCLEHAHIL